MTLKACTTTKSSTSLLHDVNMSQSAQVCTNSVTLLPILESLHAWQHRHIRQLTYIWQVGDFEMVSLHQANGAHATNGVIMVYKAAISYILNSKFVDSF